MRGRSAEVENGSVVSEAAPEEAAPEPVAELTIAAEPRLLVVTVVVVPVTAELAGVAAGIGAAADPDEPEVVAKAAFVKDGCGVTVVAVGRTYGVADAEGDAAEAVVAEDGVACALGFDAAEPDEPEPKSELETPVLVEEPVVPAEAAAAAEPAELPVASARA